MKNYYEIIGVKINSDFRTIKKQYLIKIKEYHPDVYEGDKIFAEEKTAELNEAYNILKDPELKKEYDLKLNNFLLNQEKDNKVNSFNRVEEENNIFKDIGGKIKSFFVGLKKDLSNFNKQHLTSKPKQKNSSNDYKKNLKEEQEENNKNDENIQVAIEKRENVKQKLVIWLLIITIIFLLVLIIYVI